MVSWKLMLKPSMEGRKLAKVRGQKIIEAEEQKM